MQRRYRVHFLLLNDRLWSLLNRAIAGLLLFFTRKTLDVIILLFISQRILYELILSSLDHLFDLPQDMLRAHFVRAFLLHRSDLILRTSGKSTHRFRKQDIIRIFVLLNLTQHLSIKRFVATSGPFGAQGRGRTMRS